MKYPVSVVMVLLLVVAALPHAYALRVNTTANLQVPLSVKVTGSEAGGENGSGSGSTTPALDATTLGGLVSVAAGLAYRWKKSDKHENKFDNRTVTAAETVMTQAES